MSRRKPTTERIEFPEAMVDVAERRVDDLVRACMWEPNILRSIALSCYLQGLWDGVQVVEHRPTLHAELAVARQPAVESPDDHC